MWKSEIGGHRVSGRIRRLDSTAATQDMDDPILMIEELEQAIRIEPGGLVKRNRQALMRICELDH